MPGNKVLDKFPWVRTDAIGVSGSDVPRPETIWELRDHPLRPVYTGLFLDWLAGRPDAQRARAAVHVLLACWDGGLDYQQSTEPPGQGLVWQVLTGFVKDTPLGTWKGAQDAIWKVASLYAG